MVQTKCLDCGGILLPLTGHWTDIEEGAEQVQSFYCKACGNNYEVTRRNVAVEEVTPAEDDE